MKSLALLLSLALCSAAAVAQTPSLPSGHPALDAKKQAKGATVASLPQKATVISSIDVPQYTYIEVSQNGKTLWLAASSMKAKKGDVVRFDAGMPMSNFHSKSLNRTFPSITFVNQAVISKE